MGLIDEQRAETLDLLDGSAKHVEREAKRLESEGGIEVARYYRLEYRRLRREIFDTEDYFAWAAKQSPGAIT